MSRIPIQDNLTNTKLSPQRKYQLRNPEKEAERRKRYRKSEAGKAAIRSINQRQWEKRKGMDNVLDIANSTFALFQGPK